MKTVLVPLAISLCLLSLVACGGSGGGSDSVGVSVGVSDSVDVSDSGSSVDATISGVASKGPIEGGQVTIYPLNPDGSKGDVQIGTAVTAADGSYIMNIGNYTGSALIEIKGGTYTDEATGEEKTNTVLRTATDLVSGITVATTPLTEMAVQSAGDLTLANIEAANQLFSNLIGGIDIISTLPIDVLTPSSAAATIEQQDYSLVLAALSQIVADNTDWTSIDYAISTIVNDLEDGQLDATGAELITALTNFLESENNQSGVTTNGTGSLSRALTEAETFGVPGAEGILSEASLQGSYHMIEDSLSTGAWPGGGGVENGGFGMDSWINNIAVNFGGDGTCSLSDSGASLEFTLGMGHEDRGVDLGIVGYLIPEVGYGPDSATMGCNYTVSPSGSLTIKFGNGPRVNGRVSADGMTIVSMASRYNGSSTYHSKRSLVGVKAGNDLSNASLQGKYYMIEDSLRTSTWPGGGGIENGGFEMSSWVNNIAISFGGNGTCSLSHSGASLNLTLGMGHEDRGEDLGIVGYLIPEVGYYSDSAAKACTYSVSSRGELTITFAGELPIKGKVSADGTTIISMDSRYSESNNYHLKRSVVGVKAGNDLNNASLQGNYYMIEDSLSTSTWPGGGGVENGGFEMDSWVNNIAVNFGGDGTCSLSDSGASLYLILGMGHEDRGEDLGIVGYLIPEVGYYPDSAAMGCTYSVSSEGDLTMLLDGEPTIRGKVSADGMTIISMDYRYSGSNNYHSKRSLVGVRGVNLITGVASQ